MIDCTVFIGGSIIADSNGPEMNQIDRKLKDAGVAAKFGSNFAEQYLRPATDTLHSPKSLFLAVSAKL
jgi:hypothetical protein